MSVNSQRAHRTTSDWNEHFPPGTLVVYRGGKYATWSWAAQIDHHATPGVFLEGIEEPVPLSLVDVPGWVQVRARR